MQKLHCQGQAGLHHLLITVMANSTQPGRGIHPGGKLFISLVMF